MIETKAAMLRAEGENLVGDVLSLVPFGHQRERVLVEGTSAFCLLPSAFLVEAGSTRKVQLER